MSNPSRGFGASSFESARVEKKETGPRSPSSISDKTWTVYLLRCNDGTIYTGCTNDLMDRLKQYENGNIHYTSTRLPIRLETYMVFSERFKAFGFERYLKSGSGKAFMMKRFL
ncbi:MAG: GIY-YIG nuclease family protein [Saprospiraceae bacterium]|nr:GIY-YIG nuclease family protein [Saprospiraceae bacterium]